MEPTNFSGEFSEFTHKTIIEPAEISFWGAFCLGLLEGLNRLKGLTEEIFIIWEKIFEKLEKGKELNGIKSVTRFEDGLRMLKEVDKTSGKGIIEELFVGRVDVVKATKLIACGCMETENEIIANDQISIEAVMKGFSLALGIHIICFTDKKYRLFKCSSQGPIIFLHNKNDQYSVLYHYSAKYLDEKTEIAFVDFKNFPFFYNPNSKLELRLIKETDSIPNKFIEIGNLLAYNLKPLNVNSRNDIKQIINNLKIICPEFKDKLEDLYNKIVEVCDHKAKEYVPVCLQSHCAICLMDTILESNGNSVLCPCNVELSKADILFLSGQSSNPNNTCRLVTIPHAPEKRKNRNSFINSYKLPAIRLNTFCNCCKKQMKSENFVGIYCSQHQVCLNCRASSVLKGIEKCPICKRTYSIEEITILKMRNNSIDLTSSVLTNTLPSLH